ncbi:MAG: DNA polymerase III subunit alpha [Desulfarculus sp.]|nr:DNA polymerase III subunit alpha [Desulfarculus sp.]
MRFLPLHTHSAFSFLYGTFHPQALVEAVAARSGAGVCLCDWHGLYGMVRLAKAGQERRLYTLCGVELALAQGGSLILYPQDAAGHASLCRLVTRAHLGHQRGQPRLELAWLQESSRVLAVIPGLAALEQGAAWLARVAEVCPGPVFLGLPGPEAGDAGRDLLRQWAGAVGLDCLAAPEVVALESPGLVLHKALVSIAQTIHHRQVEPLPPGAGLLPTDTDLARWFSAAEVKSTWRVADLCAFELPLGRRYLPAYPTPPGQTPQRLLSARCLKGLARRGLVDKTYAGRLLKELKAIHAFGFDDYFLLVADIVDFARNRGIRCTVRGSAAGSLVTWLLCGGPDPVAHDLLFERFLNDGRNEPPDVDLDFDSLRRDEVLRHVMERFPGGAAMVATVPTFRARSAIRELCLASGGSRERAGALTDFIPHYARPDKLPHLLQVTPEMKGHPLAKEPRLLALAVGISGLPRQLSVHLGGVAIGPLEELVPVELSAQGLPVVQLDKDDVEALGLIEMDLLGLRMHSAIAASLAALEQAGQTVDLERVPLDDQAVYELLCSTDTLGIFQVESPGQRGLLGRLQPRSFHDLIVEISLFRPGPMRADMVTPYVERHAGRQPLTYAHPLLEPILKETLGVVVFQEQVLRIAHVLAGLSYGQADGLRRAMTHRRTPAQMQGMRADFMGRCLERGVDEGVALLLWDQVSSFASYGFPKAHAAAFAFIAYQSAWLRTHHPPEFFLGLLNAGHVGGYPPRVLLNEARRQGCAILPPDVNQSRDLYTLEQVAIRVPLVVIRGMGPAGVAKILEARQRGGPFLDVFDLARRTRLNRTQMEALRQAGALNALLRRAA